MVEVHAEAVAQNGCNGGIKESGPVAAELDAEATAGKTGADGHHPLAVRAFGRGDAFKFFAVFLERIVLTDGFPCEFADVLNGCHVDAMLVTPLKLGERVFLVTEIHLQHIVGDVNMERIFRQSQIGCTTLHVA